MHRNIFATILLALAALALPAVAEETPLGLWKLSTYKVPSGAAATVQVVCFKSDRTWYSTTEANWNGAWFMNGSEVQWYGSVPISGVGNVATIGMGEILADQSMSGKYAEWVAPGSAPFSFDRHYTYTLKYQQADCPPPKR